MMLAYGKQEQFENSSLHALVYLERAMSFCDRS